MSSFVRHKHIKRLQALCMRGGIPDAIFNPRNSQVTSTPCYILLFFIFFAHLYLSFSNRIFHRRLENKSKSIFLKGETLDENTGGNIVMF